MSHTQVTNSTAKNRKNDNRLGIYWTIFLTCFALHNIEEVLRGLPAWSSQHDYFDIWSDTTFAFAAIAVWLLALAAMLITRKNTKHSKIALIIACVAMFINGLQHIATSLVTQSIMPGVVTAPLLLLVCDRLSRRLMKKEDA